MRRLRVGAAAITGVFILACSGDATPTNGEPEGAPEAVAAPAKAAKATNISNAGTHCAEAETVWMSCTSTKSRVLSLCSTTPFGPEGSLFYLFGPLGSPELAYPESPTPFAEAFGWNSEQVWEGPSGPPPAQVSTLDFTREGVTYTLTQTESAKTSLEIKVAEAGKTLATLDCSTELVGTLADLGDAGL